MVRLSEVFKLLARGVFANVKIGQTGNILKEDYPKIIGYLNLGLETLSERFVLAKGELKLHLQENTNTYYLRAESVGAISEMGSDIYIEENELDPFEDNLVKLLSVYDEDENNITINNVMSIPTVLEFSHDTIIVQPITVGSILSLVYQKSHAQIIYTDTLDPERYELNIPRYILPALLFYIAAQNFAGMNSKVGEGEVNMGNTYLYQYENTCIKLEQLSLSITNQDSNQQFDNNGWV